ncbi:unnamed protein product [Paramecium octaurelia]|uniref:Uncharacterized protein n=1 Tax=Paramecium octaurelia TaxID=43137 RepID=A0A8S1WTS0_PAROT|nr:unnamed protein product [Paramecium octaurelia]
MNSYLISKYSQSTHYHYKKGINDILEGKRCQLLIKLKDLQCYDTPQEHLTKYYHINQLRDKLHMLGEYYKYHNDIPRLFMIPAIIPLNYFHDRKRRLAFFRIARLIAQENHNNPDKPQKGIVGDSPIPLTSEQITPQDPSSSDEILSKNDKILQGISFLIQEPDSIEKIKQQIQSMIKLKKQPNTSSTKINSIGSNTTTSKSNKQSILKQTKIPQQQPQKSKSPPLKIQSASIQLIDVASPRNQKQSKQASPKNIQQFTKSKPKSPSVNMASPVQQFMKLSAKMKQSFNKQQCSSARNNTNIPNSANQRKSSVTHILNILKSPNKNSSQQIQHISSTPRDQESKRSFNNKKVHQLELQVMSDLQSLLQKKTCLTHRSSMTNKNCLKKKLNTRELNQFKCVRLPLSNRDVNNQQKE